MKSSLRAFTLVEVLVVVALIGVLSSLAIPAMSGDFGKADADKIERNAQTIVSIFNSARAAGNSTSYASATDAIAAVMTSPGISGRGQYSTSQFYVPMETPQITEASARIALGLAGTATEGSLTII